jgi:hypothetical protein
MLQCSVADWEGGLGGALDTVSKSKQSFPLTNPGLGDVPYDRDMTRLI